MTLIFIMLLLMSSHRSLNNITLLYYMKHTLKNYIWGICTGGTVISLFFPYIFYRLTLSYGGFFPANVAID